MAKIKIKFISFLDDGSENPITTKMWEKIPGLAHVVRLGKDKYYRVDEIIWMDDNHVTIYVRGRS